MRFQRVIGCVLLLLASTATSGCRRLADAVLPQQPLQDDRNLSVSFYGVEGFGSAAPTVKMVQQFYRGSSAGQQEIHQFMLANPRGGWGGDPVTTETLANALAVFSGETAYHTTYVRSQVYERGRRGADQAIADLQAAIESGQPPVLQWHAGIHYAVAKAVGWSLVPGPSGWLHPSANWFRIHLPRVGPEYYSTVVNFRDDIGFSPDVIPVIFTRAPGLRVVASAEWAEYDEVGGTYYGDPNPPLPECPPHCPRMGVPEGKYGLETGLHSIPVLNPKTDAEVEKDLIAGLVRTRLDREIGLESLTAGDGRLQVETVQRVQALSDRPDYFLVRIITADGTPYALATVTATGWLGAVTRDEGRSPVVVGSTHQAVTEFEGKTASEADSAQLVFAYGTLSPTEFQPVYLITRGDARFYLTLDGRLFREGTGDAAPKQTTLGDRQNAEGQYFLSVRGGHIVSLVRMF